MSAELILLSFTEALPHPQIVIRDARIHILAPRGYATGL